MPDGARWRALLGTPGPILADGAMGTILFEAGLTSGDSPERWNVVTRPLPSVIDVSRPAPS